MKKFEKRKLLSDLAILRRHRAKIKGFSPLWAHIPLMVNMLSPTPIDNDKGQATISA